MSALILPLLLFAVFYFVLLRPQQRKIKEQAALVERAGAGDRVLMTSGIYGTCLLYTSPSPRDRQKSRMPSSA